MTRLALLVLAATLFWPLSLAAQVNPVNDFFGGFSVSRLAGDETGAAGNTLAGWQVAVSQKIRSTVASALKPTPISIAGDFGRQSKTLDDGRTLHVSQYMGGVRVRAGRINTVAPGVRRVDPISVFVHALAGGTTRGAGDASTTGFMMRYGGGVDVMPNPRGEAYALGIRVQFDWLPSRIDGTWSTNQFRLGAGVVLMVRGWD